MIHGNSVLGKPLQIYVDTKTNIEALSNITKGCEAYSSDTLEKGIFNGAIWVWTSNNVITGTPGTLTVSTTNVTTSPHTHAITTSTNPGANASILATTSAGLVAVQGLGVGTAGVTTARILSKGTSITQTTTFTGTGLNDFSQTGQYGGSNTGNILFTIVIDATGTPDTFSWKAGNMGFVTGVAITGGSQSLRDGVSIKFNATTGHTLNDQWTFNVSSVPVFSQQAISSTASSFNVGSNGQIGIGVAPTDGILVRASTTISSPYYDPLTSYYYGSTYDLAVNPSANTVSGWRAYGMQCNVTKVGNFTAGQLIGGRFNVGHSGGTVTYIIGGGFIVQSTGASGSSTTVSAAEFEIQKYTAGTTFTAGTTYLLRGAYTTVAGSWAVTNAYGLYLGDVNLGSSGNFAIVTNAGNVVFNEGGDSATDFRVESDTEANMLFLDSNADTNGAIYLGGTTNGIKINKGGDLTLLGTATVYDDVQVNLSNIKAPASDPPTWTTYKGCEVPAFGAGNTNVLYFTLQLPHSWKEGSSIEPHIHVAYPNGNTGDSRWQFTYSWANIDGTFPTATTITSTFAAGGTTDIHKLHSFGAITATGKTASSVILCSISRIGADALDTYGSVIYAISADFHIEKDRLGAFTA